MGAGGLTVGRSAVPELIARVLGRGERRRWLLGPERAAARTAPLERGGRTVRLAEPASRPPLTPVERLVVATLKRKGAISLDRLVEQVAFDLYREELRAGGWILDLGVFGSAPFVSDAARELEAGHGILWEIEAAERAC